MAVFTCKCTCSDTPTVPLVLVAEDELCHSTKVRLALIKTVWTKESRNWQALTLNLHYVLAMWVKGGEKHAKQRQKY